ncbi:receptor-type tyrosine-protein phosphatase T-like [Saccostrea echinata]|uniref:receptor-type tyrosine-protein phosphatase T-like n=1 Tax=Saccostrea echinata TaxID=191078 RepID=UPI002A7F6775|nr:receptor-type tyrosine-protein phosphatase T-like [Saccostrea echinata]
MVFISVRIYCLALVIGCTRAYVNVALNKPTWQSNPLKLEDIYDSSNAVDGLKSNLTELGGQCVISAVKHRTATWWVNLTSVYSIHDIRIYYKTDNDVWSASNGYTTRFLGFYVYVSNTTNRLDGHLCFHDTIYIRSTIPAVVNITCLVHGQYVIYYNERLSNLNYPTGYSAYAYNELCEVEVYGCKAGYYGPNCSLPCPNNCRYCHIETGVCSWCKPGYQGDQCALGCEMGFYGSNCSLRCPSICRNCHIETGECSWCKPGYQGYQCETECGGDRYGQDCGQRCGACLEYKQCHHINGSCTEGCDAGYEGTFCDSECLEGKFGNNCEQNCNENCGIPNQCNRMTGKCDGGCQPGWEGLLCSNECSNNQYGKNCSETCGKCRPPSSCHHINGSCLSGCGQGYQGIDCLQECSSYTYGFDCMQNCSDSCVNNTCDSFSGECPIYGASTQKNKGKDQVAVVGGIAGALTAILVILIVVLVLRRHHARKGMGDNKQFKRAIHYEEGDSEENVTDVGLSSSKKRKLKTSIKAKDEKSLISNKDVNAIDVDEDELIHAENPYGEMYMNNVTTPDILISRLERIISEKSKDDNDGFQKEYATLPYGENHKCDIGKRDENVPKNRFKTTFPYDHTRVILRTETGTDYINANYIEGAERDHEYIASQGPKQNTVGDFWTMIWQENVSAIVMLTNLKERNKIKCTQYWPDGNKHINYGIVSVKMIEEKEYAFYVVRKMTVIQKETKKSRVVTQHHYTSWPDHGTPDPLCLVVFLDHVTRTRTNQNDSPTVVHCSAGIGRTGTYIAIDALNKIGRKTGKVNVAEYVKKMRENRMNMVQTYEQYITIFLALNEIYKSPVNVNSVEEFIEKAQSITMDKPANQSELHKEFQLLMKVRPTYTDSDYKLAKEGCGGEHTNGILPLDKYSVHLSSVVSKRGNFINAIYVPSYTKSRAFVVTRYPPAEDSVDFLRLLNDHESDTVICLDPLNEIESSKAWLPTPSSSKIVTPFTVHYQSKTGTDVKSTTIHLMPNKIEEEAQSVTIIEPKVTIKKSGNPLDTSQLRGLVSVSLSSVNEKPITVVSKDGASLCGVFCAVHNVIQQINMDDRVDVFTAVRQLQVRRPEFCTNFDEYGIVFRSVYDHIQSATENIYSNQ